MSGFARVVDPADAREAAQHILSGRQYRSSPTPRPLRKQLSWLGDRLHKPLDWIGNALSHVPRLLLIAIDAVRGPMRIHLAAKTVEAGQEGAAVGEAQGLVVEQNPCRDQRPGQRAAAGLVGAGHETGAERAVEGKQALGTAQAALVPLGALRGTRSGPAASRWRRPLR